MEYSKALEMASRMGVKVIDTLDEGDEAHGNFDCWDDTIYMKESLGANLKGHVLVHEICHATGTEARLNRDTLIKYSSCRVYALVEECIVETAALVILETNGTRGDRGPLMGMMAKAADEGIEPEEDINPEVTRILEYLLGGE